ncbi:UDP-2,3-diacylglucosamine diphosphatase [Campylobacter sp. faydin G-24]|uniref:UDP-2,3-diacylglucosamine diphosphatase n=1 Tax=Campylobacter anatolicus TaxID=2829105 RepID=A0ABS5HGY3_9BACT|nr:UDP-2,3-diacylglucosamine diphosphatase [Campylobacter anatolicus]MBR8463536.1 UDP-2,3-diacylglucosamine diphosphatase [Campylobacter anatolicus]
MHLNDKVQIKDGAIFISDAHENSNRDGFLKFLKAIDSGEIAATQLFLMGDMFDFLSFYATNTVQIYAEHIALINKIALKIEVIYIEGNHDFNLINLFKNVKIFPIELQPLRCETPFGNSVQIAHGDNFLPFVSRYTLLFLRLKWFLKFMNFLDILCGYKISNAILSSQINKKLDYKIPNFKDYISTKMQHYNAKFIIEGHYHQGEIFDIKDKIYINLPLFAYDQSYFIVKYQDEKLKFARKSLKGH